MDTFPVRRTDFCAPVLGDEVDMIPFLLHCYQTHVAKDGLLDAAGHKLRPVTIHNQLP